MGLIKGRAEQKPREEAEPEQKQSKNPEKEIIHSKKKRGGTEEKNPKTEQRPKKNPEQNRA